MGCIYSVTSKTSGKKYIGKTKENNLKERHRSHRFRALCKKTNTHFYSAIRLYGWDDFEWEILFYADNDEDLFWLEKLLIKYFDTYNNGYNSTLGGEGSLGHIFTEEQKRHISESLQGGKHPWLGKKHSEETKKKMSENNWMKGKHHSEEVKKRMSEERKGKPGRRPSEEGIKRISEANKGKIISEESRKKMSDVQSEICGIKVRCVETGEIFRTMTDAALKVYGDKKYIYEISRCLKKNKTYKGHHWEKIDQADAIALGLAYVNRD